MPSIRLERMTPVLEALLVAAMAGTLASVTAGFINRAILRIKRKRKLAKQPAPPSPDCSVDLDVVIS